MKNWRSYLVLYTGIVLILVSFIIYGLRVSETFIPSGSSTQQIAQLTQKYGLDRPVIEQYEWFLFTFLPGLTLLGIYGTVGMRRQTFPHWILTKLVIVLMLVTNTITMLIFFVTAQASLNESPWAFILALLNTILALANFIYLLVVWNGYKWAVWAFGISSFILCTLKFIGHLPIFPVLFELSSVIILIYLIRWAWPEME